MSVHHKRETCRLCGGRRLRRWLWLGDQPLANAFLRSPEEFASEPRYPLEVYCCETCALVQLLEVIDPQVLFREYIYATGTSETMVTHFAGYAREAATRASLTPGDLVVEVASNDGTLLRCFRDLGMRVLGVEPAGNLARQAESAGIRTWNEFFGEDLAARILESFGKAKLVAANNVLAHVDDPIGLLRGAARLLAQGGRVVVEVPDLGELVDGLAYDTIYHEHLCYFSEATLARCCEEAGLAVEAMERLEVHGGSLRAVGQAFLPVGAVNHAPLPEISGFDAKVERHRQALRGLLESLRTQGKTIAAYGAPAKGNTLLNYCGIGPDLVAFTVDRNPSKVGRYTPGAHLPVLPVEELARRRPDYALLLAWNLEAEVLRQQEPYRAAGGRFIAPLPEPRIL